VGGDYRAARPLEGHSPGALSHTRLEGESGRAYPARPEARLTGKGGTSSSALMAANRPLGAPLSRGRWEYNTEECCPGARRSQVGNAIYENGFYRILVVGPGPGGR